MISVTNSKANTAIVREEDPQWLMSYLGDPNADEDLKEIQRGILNHRRHYERARGVVLIVGDADPVFEQALTNKEDVDLIGWLTISDAKRIVGCNQEELDAFMRSSDTFSGLEEYRPDYMFVAGERDQDPDELSELAASLSEKLRPREAGWLGQEIRYAKWLAHDVQEEISMYTLMHFFDRFAVPGMSNVAYADQCKEIQALNLDEIMGIDQEMSLGMSL